MNINELQRTDFGSLASQEALYCKCKCWITNDVDNVVVMFLGKDGAMLL